MLHQKLPFIAAALLLFVFAACAGTGGRRAAANNACGSQSGGLFSHGKASDPVDGVYEGTARAYRGPVSVRLTIAGGVISEIEITDSIEDRFVGGAAMDELLELALMYDTADLDAVSGATESSEGFLAAVAAALEKAGNLPTGSPPDLRNN